MKHRRERLPDHRRSVTHRVKIGGVKIFIVVGLYPDGRPGEIFIKAGCVNSIPEGETEFGLQGWCNAIGILWSLALQGGVSLSVICRKLSHQSFKPDGFTDTDRKFAKSIVDYLARWMWKEFGWTEKGEGGEDEEDENQGYFRQGSPGEKPDPGSEEAPESGLRRGKDGGSQENPLSDRALREDSRGTQGTAPRDRRG